MTVGTIKLGTQHDSSDATLRVLAALGVNHICSGFPPQNSTRTGPLKGSHAYASASNHSASRSRRSRCLSARATSLNLKIPNIMLGKSPARDREIDEICQMIRNCREGRNSDGEIQPYRSGRGADSPTPGRGGATYSTFVYEEAKQEPPLTEAGPVSAESMWERITYFLKRVVPVAEENKVKLACHPHDPGMPADRGYRGVHRVLGSVDGLKRFIEIGPSPYHGLNFCQGQCQRCCRIRGAKFSM